MKTYTLRLALAVLVALTFAGCDLFEIDDRPDPNGPSVDDILDNPTAENISAVAIGVEASARIDLNLYLADVGNIGREHWRFSASDPRFTGDLLGKGTSVLDDNTFYLTRPWTARYRTIRDANVMLEALGLNTTLSDDQKADARGFAKTWKAYQYLLNLNLTYQNGIRFIGPGDDGPGPLVGYDEALNQIAALLDEAAGDFSGSASFFFPTTLSVDYAAFNRALAARVDLYREDYAGVFDALDDSFLDADGDLSAGAYHVFSSGSNDFLNPFFLPPDADGDLILAHPSYVEDIEDGDERISKVFDRGSATTVDGLTSQYGFFVYKSGSDPLPIITNAELVLIRAEARAQTGDVDGAISDLNVIRNAAGLDDYDGDATQAAVLDEVLFQRRYELYGEGHRWVDVRRFGQLDTLPIDREGDDVWVQFPIPQNENV
ncbi:MAG: RagB/SusD family nutrient uptake outer membrane protein [Rubricoccaceae bacterium]|nr:RagB/SusD family nutrient uptake outer membrane protein [Rubricoccaceae bacterium]